MRIYSDSDSEYVLIRSVNVLGMRAYKRVHDYCGTERPTYFQFTPQHNSFKLLTL